MDLLSFSVVSNCPKVTPFTSVRESGDGNISTMDLWPEFQTTAISSYMGKSLLSVFGLVFPLHGSYDLRVYEPIWQDLGYEADDAKKSLPTRVIGRIIQLVIWWMLCVCVEVLVQSLCLTGTASSKPHHISVSCAFQTCRNEITTTWVIFCILECQLSWSRAHPSSLIPKTM